VQPLQSPQLETKTQKFLYCFIVDDVDDVDDDGHDNLPVVTTTKGTKMKRWKDNLEIFPRMPLLAVACR